MGTLYLEGHGVRRSFEKAVELWQQAAAGWTLLTLAIASGCEKMVAELIKKGVDVNARDEMGQTPLHKVAGYVDYQGAWEVAEILLAHGASKTLSDHSGRLPYHIAEAKRYTRMAQILQE